MRRSCLRETQVLQDALTQMLTKLQHIPLDCNTETFLPRARSLTRSEQYYMGLKDIDRCVYTYTHTYRYVYMYIFAHIFVCVYIYMYLCVYAYDIYLLFIYIYICFLMYIWA